MENNEEEEENDVNIDDVNLMDLIGGLLEFVDNNQPMEENNVILSAEAINYDLSLPGAHQYLGADLTECATLESCHVTSSSLPELIIIRIPNVILLPFQKLPLNQINQACREALLLSKSRGENIGIMCEININVDQGIPDVNFEHCLGVTAEITQIREGTDDSFRAIVVGRQRFRVMSHSTNGLITRAKITILHEASDDIGLFPFHNVLPNVYRCQLPIMSLNTSRSHIQPCQDMFTFGTAAMTSWPLHLFQQYDIRQVCQQIKSTLYQSNDSWRLVDMDEDPIKFSYWLIHNLLLPDDWMIELLSVDHVLTRLLFSLNILRRDLTYQCTRCNSQILRHEHLVCLAKEGALQTFVNPHGHHFDMITTIVARNTCFQGDFHSEDSWFPGYSWKIMYCQQCFLHLGWMFKATKDKNLVPQHFFGVTRNNVSAELEEPDDFATMD